MILKDKTIKRLYRSLTDRKIAGVCGGLGEYSHCDPVILRIIFVVLFFMGGFGLLTYLVMWFVVPPRSTTG